MKQLVYDNRTEIGLFFTGFLQVFLVAMNTYQIAHKYWVGCFVVGFLISFIWSWNVKKIAFGKLSERIIYASGAACGTIAGLLFVTFLYETMKL